MTIKWPLTASQFVLGLWYLGIKDPEEIEQIAEIYYNLPGINTFTPKNARFQAEILKSSGFSIESLSPSDKLMARNVARLLEPLVFSIRS